MKQHNKKLMSKMLIIAMAPHLLILYKILTKCSY